MPASLLLWSLALVARGVGTAAESNGDDTYQGYAAADLAALAAAQQSDARFQRVADRPQKSALARDCFSEVMLGERYNNWRGVPFKISAFELSAYPQLLEELQPGSIIEIGTFRGGSALWLSDLADLLVSKDVPIVTLDRDHSMLHPKAKAKATIRPVPCDLFQLQECAEFLQALETLPKPWLVIEDAHVNVEELLSLLDQYLVQGDYLIVEDTSGDQSAYLISRGMYTDDATMMEGKLSSELYKSNQITAFASSHTDKYFVDTHYQDMYGYNVGKAWNSIFKVLSGTGDGRVQSTATSIGVTTLSAAFAVNKSQCNESQCLAHQNTASWMPKSL
jgi:cephalosporin hydroxylase